MRVFSDLIFAGKEQQVAEAVPVSTQREDMGACLLYTSGGRWRLRNQHQAALGRAYGEERAGTADPRDRAGAADADL